MEKKKGNCLTTMLKAFGILMVLAFLGGILGKSGKGTDKTSSSTSKKVVEATEESDTTDTSTKSTGALPEAQTETEATQEPPAESPTSTEAEASTEEQDFKDALSEEDRTKLYLAVIEPTLKEQFGEDHYEILQEDNVIAINIWFDGLATELALAKMGNKELQKTWEDLKENTQYAAEQAYKVLKEDAGVTDKILMMNLVNDANRENTILSYTNGYLIYDAMKDNDD